MGEITTVGLDLAKNVFQVHAIDNKGKVLARRRLLVTGATAVIRFARAGSSESKRWAAALLGCKPARVVTVALANKTARIVWALLTRNQSYAAPATVVA